MYHLSRSNHADQWFMDLQSLLRHLRKRHGRIVKVDMHVWPVVIRLEDGIVATVERCNGCQIVRTAISICLSEKTS